MVRPTSRPTLLFVPKLNEYGFPRKNLLDAFTDSRETYIHFLLSQRVKSPFPAGGLFSAPYGRSRRRDKIGRRRCVEMAIWEGRCR